MNGNPTEIRICKKCKWCSTGSTMYNCNYPHYPKKLNLVTGELEQEYKGCAASRVSEAGGWCGPEGRFWEPK